MYYGESGCYPSTCRARTLGDITASDLERSVDVLVSTSGRQLQRKTLNSEVSAVHGSFGWLQASGATTDDPGADLMNARY